MWFKPIPAPAPGDGAQMSGPWPPLRISFTLGQYLRNLLRRATYTHSWWENKPGELWHYHSVQLDYSFRGQWHRLLGKPWFVKYTDGVLVKEGGGDETNAAEAADARR